jgi:hypothetical protein
MTKSYSLDLRRRVARACRNYFTGAGYGFV